MIAALKTVTVTLTLMVLSFTSENVHVHVDANPFNMNMNIHGITNLQSSTSSLTSSLTLRRHNRMGMGMGMGMGMAFNIPYGGSISSSTGDVSVDVDVEADSDGETVSDGIPVVPNDVIAPPTDVNVNVSVDVNVDETRDTVTDTYTDTETDTAEQETAEIENTTEDKDEASSAASTEVSAEVEVEEAATAMASPPLRISTSQMGNEIVTNDVSKLHSKRLARHQRRQDKLLKKKVKKEERMEEKSHRVYAKKLKSRNNLNIGRKVFHAGFGFFFATLNQVLPKSIFMPGMYVITTGTLVMEVLRYRKGFGWMNDLLHWCLGGTLRKHEMEGKFTGSFYYFLGVLITAASFPTSCASLGICQLALADPSASYFGRMSKNVYWSRIENGCFGIGRNKGILGFLGGAMVCFPFNFYTLSIATISAGAVTPAHIAGASLVLGMAGAFADLCVPSPALTMPKKICGVPMPQLHVDDNIVVPIFSGWACTKIFDYLGWGVVDLAKVIIF